jgi:hypothetical protein
MKIIIFGYNNFENITTSKYLDSFKHTLLVHTEEQKKSFVKAGKISKNAKIVVSGNPKGLAFNRNYALDHLMKDGEWAMFWVDDLIRVTWNKEGITKGLEKLDINFKNQNKFREEFSVPVHAEEFLPYCESLIKKADKEGVKLVGFSCTNNPLFRPKHFKYHSFIDGRCYLVKKTFLRFDENVHSIDDMCFTALNLKSFGRVLVEDWVLPECVRYAKGVSFGNKEERMELKFKECAYLVKTYPEFIQIRHKPGFPYGTHVRLVYHEKKNKPAKVNGYTRT